MSLNKLPNGSPSPMYKCTAVNAYDDTDIKIVVLQEWWCDGRLCQPITQTAEEYFYGDGESGFDKAPFKILSIVKEV